MGNLIKTIKSWWDNSLLLLFSQLPPQREKSEEALLHLSQMPQLATSALELPLEKSRLSMDRRKPSSSTCSGRTQSMEATLKTIGLFRIIFSGKTVNRLESTLVCPVIQCTKKTMVTTLTQLFSIMTIHLHSDLRMRQDKAGKTSEISVSTTTTSFQTLSARTWLIWESMLTT